MTYADLHKMLSDYTTEILGDSENDRRFSFVGMDEVLSGVAHNISFREVSLLAEYPEEETSNDGRKKTKLCAVWFMKKADAEDFSQYHTVFVDTENALLSFEKYLLFQNKSNCRKLFLDKDSIRVNKVGPLFENAMGWRMEFNLISS